MFKRGDKLRVQPKDNDDPVAAYLAGSECTFLSYKTGASGTVYAVVDINGGKSIFFREKDLTPEAIEK